MQNCDIFSVSKYTGKTNNRLVKLLLNNFYPATSRRQVQKGNRRTVVRGSVTRYGPQSVGPAATGWERIKKKRNHNNPLFNLIPVQRDVCTACFPLFLTTVSYNISLSSIYHIHFISLVQRESSDRYFFLMFISSLSPHVPVCVEALTEFPSLPSTFITLYDRVFLFSFLLSLYDLSDSAVIYPTFRLPNLRNSSMPLTSCG